MLEGLGRSGKLLKMEKVYAGFLYGVLVAGLGVLLSIALRMLPDSPKAALLKRVCVAYAFFMIAALVIKDLLL